VDDLSFQNSVEKLHFDQDPAPHRAEYMTNEIPQMETDGGVHPASTGKPPLPPGAREGRREHQHKQQQQQHKQEVSQAGVLGDSSPHPPVTVVVEGGEVGPVEDEARRNVARMRARGHKRASSAPIPYQPSPAASVPPAQHIGHGEGRDRERETGRHTQAKGVMESEAPPLVVPYLSPVVLRKELETLITQDGSDMLGKEGLVTSSPSVYWNLVWYFSRLQLPTHLPFLTLWSFTHANRELRKQSVQMKVDLLWDKRFSDIPDPLYLMWLGKVPRAMQLPSSPGMTRRDSSSQLQSLVAKTQWGQLTPVLTNLLEDRQRSVAAASSTERRPRHRSVYRETLFFKAAIMGSINVDQFDQEYRQAVQRLPRSLSSLLSLDDYPPPPRALHCRTNFGPLQVT
jgi:hypothetical protein